MERKHLTAINFLKVYQHLIMDRLKIYKWCKTPNMQHQHQKNKQKKKNGLILIMHKSHRGLKSYSFGAQKLKSNNQKKTKNPQAKFIFQRAAALQMIMKV